LIETAATTAVAVVVLSQIVSHIISVPEQLRTANTSKTEAHQ